MGDRCDLVLRDVLCPGGTIADISIAGGVVRHVGGARSSAERIQCSGKIVIPAGIDMHVHMRDGSQRAKEDWRTGSMSALAGGVTIVVDQPNTVPPIESAQQLAGRVGLAKAESLCGFAINGAVTEGSDVDGLWRAGAMAFGEIFSSPSSYGEAVGEPRLSEAFDKCRSLGAMATIHAEDPLGMDAADLAVHNRNRPAAGEARAVNRVSRLNNARCRLHFCHLSTASAVRQAEGSVEVAPHHLFLSLEQFSPQDPFGKVNPPLRSDSERRNLLAAWDRIDVIASDHAPHTEGEKSLPFNQSPAGIPGVETMIPLLLAGVLQGKFSLASVIEKCALRPAALLGIPPAGFMPGCRGDFAVFPREIAAIDPDSLHSRAGWTPYEGFEAVFPEIVVMGGATVFRYGEFIRGRPVWYAGRGYIPGTHMQDGADTARP
jgi:dihydroorotase